MRYEFAAKLAVNACERLMPFCEGNKIHIAGSLRRRLPEISDIDLICVPRYEEVVSFNLFGYSDFNKKVSINFVDTVKSIGAIMKGSPDGRYMSLNIQGYKVDVFMPQPDDFYRQYCIRTGSADYVHWNIAKAWNKKGWCGTDQGLRRIEDCKEIVSASEKKKWEIVKQEGEKPPAWESEEHFFDWLGVNWIHPRFRKI